MLPHVREIARAARPHQWVKNVLVFVPLVLAHAREGRLWASAAWAFAAMCFASSGAYLVNDIADAGADRLHPLKKDRPFARGAVDVRMGAVLAALLLGVGLAIAYAVSFPVGVAVLGYVALTFAYTLWLKTILAVDVLLLAGLYCLRLRVGGTATGIVLSPWTLAFAMFLFLSLALMKRFTELHNMRAAGTAASRRRGYRTDDMPAVAALGSASGMTSALVIALYVNGEDVRRLYSNPNLLFGISAVVLLWIVRLWLLANRGEIGEDPVLYAVRDPWSLGLGVAATAVLIAAS